MQSPAPSPSPILVQMVGSGDGAPWWGVPVVAGVFLLLGGLLTFLLNRSNDRRRVQVEREEALTDELLELAAELIALGNRFQQLGQTSLVTSLQEFLPRLVPESTELINEHTKVFNRLLLVMPHSLQKTVVKYSAACTSLIIPPFDKESMTLRLNNQAYTENKFINELRRLRGLSDLELAKPMGAQEAKSSFANRAAEELIRNLREQGVPIVDNATEPAKSPQSPSNDKSTP